jgi:uncharacterized protein (TIGR00730 family)
MKIISSLCIFCGSSTGSRPEYVESARLLGSEMVSRDITLVYGGSNIGVMRAIADTVLGLGGRAIGVMPQQLIDREVAHKGLTDFHVVSTMSERKERMARLSDAFIALPGGIGTLDEIFEVMSWNQLEIIDKPIALLNTCGYWDGLIRFLDHSVKEKFVRPEHRNNLLSDHDPIRLLDRLSIFEQEKVDNKWVEDLKTKGF